MLLTLISQLVNGLSIGALYALVAAGLALTIGVLRVVNFAHGDLFMIGSYLFWFLFVQLGIGYLLTALIMIPLMAMIGVLFYLLVIRPVLRKSWQVQLIATLAASTILNNGVIWLIGSEPRTALTVWSQSSVDLGGIELSKQRLAALIAAPLIFAALDAYLKYTRTGMAMRAVSQNREAAEVVGGKRQYCRRGLAVKDRRGGGNGLGGRWRQWAMFWLNDRS